MAKAGRKPVQRTEVEKMLWVASHLDADLDAKTIKDDLTRNIFRWVKKSEANEDDFMKKTLPLAIRASRKEQEEGAEVEETEMEGKNLERLEKRVVELMKGQKQVYCEKCWDLLDSEDDGVEVVHD